MNAHVRAAPRGPDLTAALARVLRISFGITVALASGTSPAIALSLAPLELDTQRSEAPGIERTTSGKFTRSNSARQSNANLQCANERDGG